MRALVWILVGAAVLALIGVVAYLAGTEAAGAVAGGTGAALVAARKAVKFKQERLTARKEQERREIAQHAQEAERRQAQAPNLVQAKRLLAEVDSL